MQNFAGLVRSAFILLTALALGLTAVANAQSHNSQTSIPSNKANVTRARAVYAQLPLIFEQNQGQTDSQVKFLAHGNGYGLFLTQNAAVLSLQQMTAGKQQKAVLNMQLVGAKGNSTIAGVDRLPGTSSYFIGNDPTQWHRNIPQYGRVQYEGVYPGVDLIYYGNQGKLEYDFRLAAHSNPDLLKLHFSGADDLKIAENGDLVIATKAGDVHLQAPQVYQQFGNTRREVSSRYVLSADNNIQFSLGNYDRTRELVIDPVLTYSTYVGGTGSESCSAILGTANAISGCPAIAADPIANIYIAGISNSADFPNPMTSPTKTGTANVFIAKININASGAAQLINSVFLGGNGTDFPAGIALDSGFRVIVVGTTSSTNFPVISQYTSPSASVGNHVFVTKLDLTADTLNYSTYLAGNGVDTASGVALDGSSNIYVTGTTTSTDTPSQSDVFPSTLGSFQSASRATSQFFFTKINSLSSGVNSILYSTYFGGGNPTNGMTVGGGIAVDIGGNVYLTGGTNFLNTQNNPSLDFPILNASQICLDTPVNPSGTCSVALTNTDAFVAKFAPVTGSTNQFTLNYSTYLGGTGNDIGFGVALDSSGDALVTGSTTSGDFVLPTSTTPFQSSNNGGSDAFVAKLGAFTPLIGSTATQAVPIPYFSYLGGSGTDVGLAIAADNTGGAYVTGYTNSPDFPTNNGLFTTIAGAQDAFAARVDTNATASVAPSEFMTYLGGAGNDAGTSIIQDTQGGTLVAGETFSSNFPTKSPFQGSLAGSSDAFITRFGPSASLTMTASPSPSPAGVGNQVTFTYTITNSGDSLANLTFTDAYPPASVTSVTGTTTNSGSCSPGSNGVLTCTVGAISGAGGTATVSVLMTPNSGGLLVNSAAVTSAGCATPTCASAQATASISDFSVASNPTSVTAVAGQPASYQLTVTPTGGFPESVTLACSSTLPTGANCNFTNNPITTLTGAQSRTLIINTTARTTVTTQLLRSKNAFYAMFFPVSGMVLVGACFGGVTSRKRRLLIAMFICALFGTVMVQAGCGSSGTTTTVSGTPAGTYNVTLTATSGSASRTTVITLNVQ